MLPPRLSTHPMGRATVCLAVLLLAVAYLFVSVASESLAAVQRVGSGRSPPAHCCKQEGEAVARQAQTAVDLADLVSAEQQGQKPESHRSKKKKISDDDHDDDEHDDNDHNDGRHDDDDDDDDGHDDNGGSDTDHDSDSDSVRGSHSDHDPNNHHDDNSKRGKKKRSAPGENGVQGGTR